MTGRWVRAAGAAQLAAAGGVLGVRIEGQRIALYAVGDAVFATADRCTHGAARLSKGFLEGPIIECPLHQGMFDVRTGAPTGGPCDEPVQCYPARKEGADILIEISR